MILVKSIILHLFVTLCTAYSMKNILRIHRLEICNQSEGTALRVDYLNFMNQEHSGPRIDAINIVTRDIRPTLRLKVELTRCMSREALDTCEPYTQLKPLDTCALLKLPNMAWTDLVEAFRPPIKCPLKKGVYKLKNATFHTDLFIFFSFENFYWRTKLYFSENNEFSALCADFQVIKVTV